MLTDEGTSSVVLASAPLGRGLGRERADRQVQIHAGVDPEGVDREIGEVRGDRDPQPAFLAHPAQDQRRERVGRDDGVRTRLEQLPVQGPPGGQAHEPDDGSPQHRGADTEGLVGQVVGPREDPKLEEIGPADESAQFERDQPQIIDDPDIVATSHQPALKFPRGPIVTRPHRRRDDQNPSTHNF